MEFITYFWNNQPTAVMGIVVAIFVLVEYKRLKKKQMLLDQQT